ncbi:hypothetical protein STCU_12241 [Strigomonas culicis]|uniref:USP domain-containing protein n=1 Tax=Strigomonas culicis TaxID=28005 RepID=S9TE31_9TRYP|nr:hypothetical protein STCU_12241 [Strigomonas culicis]|eukprot:EPY15214.1 hypothetical protein STCU_12241 [Strigomonas culicis]
MFELGDQHDAQEFLVALLDTVGEELRLASPAGTVAQSLPSHTVLGDVDALARQWRSAHLMAHNSLVTHLFSGQTVQRVSCPRCAASSFCCDAFSSLFIPLLYPAAQDWQVSIEDCLAECFRDECVEMAARCSECKEMSAQFVRRQGLYCLPPYLVLCVNRFKKDAYGMFTRKRTTSLRFGERLHMGPWMSEAVVPAARSESGGIHWADVDRPRSRRGEYALFGVVNHVGDLYHGHYVSYCERSDHWFLFNDKQVTESPVSPCERPGCGSEVYILFYRSLTHCC